LPLPPVSPPFPYTTLFRSPPGTDRQFAGVIDDVRVYPRALGATHIEALYNWDGSTPTDELPTDEFNAGVLNQNRWTFVNPRNDADRKSTRLNSSHVKISYA